MRKMCAYLYLVHNIRFGIFVELKEIHKLQLNVMFLIFYYFNV